MPYPLLVRWRAYSGITGTIGQDRDDIMHALNTSAIINANRKKGSAPVKPQRLMPYRYTNDEIEEAEFMEKLQQALKVLS